MADPDFAVDVGGQGTVGRIIQAGVYNEAFRPVAKATFPQFVGVPDRNPLFLGRDDELTALERACGEDEPVVIAQAAIGLGGIGKTALAVEFCHRRRAHTEVVRWLNAENRQTLISEFLRMAPALGVDTHGLEIDDAIARTRGWMEQTPRRWLLVFDNVQTPDVLDQLVPAHGHGVVVITSRHRDWSGMGVKPLRLGVLASDAAVDLLCKTAGRQPDDAARRLVEQLGCLTLAIVQAGAFARQTGWTFDHYRGVLAARAAQLLAKNAAGLSERDRADLNVLTVWDTSLRRAATEAEGAGAVLHVLAYTAADFFPRALLVGAGAAGEEALGRGDELYVDEGIAALARYSLIERSRDPQPGRR